MYKILIEVYNKPEKKSWHWNHFLHQSKSVYQGLDNQHAILLKLFVTFNMLHFQN